MKNSRKLQSLRRALVAVSGLTAFAVVVPQLSAQEAVFACAQPGSGILYVVDEAGACKSPKHIPLEWAATASEASIEMHTEPLELLNGWQSYGEAFGQPTATRYGDLVVLEGLIRHGEMPAVAAQLPEGWAPAKKLLFGAPTWGDQLGRVDVLRDGSVKVVSGNDDWLSLSGVYFTVAPDEK
ncbi:MAG: hypothetical protein GWM92_12650 [Gemmatimonadetes bacterium]|nr:hypothetical protein [Gemmatimonadota bacterium]NIT88228.1 hypothetical protein [Gemmatimonadota bacterium]NIU32036.1 hypothetical protein [Gemmatimonadota bacterium]NIU36645.1 hypothetical protein [Gemmatimonadota bacterium]NIV62407.1 hypothetical protein [Gemmatimonadota bacterium]